MEPISALSAAAETVKEATAEVLNEASEIIKEVSPIQDNIETIENSTLEGLKGQNELSQKTLKEIKSKQLEINRENGALREEKALNDLETKYPESNGYKIHREQYLRNPDGEIVKGPQTGEARRVDFMVEKDGEIVKSIEVTSKTAPKESQISKENNIRNEGGNYIKDRDTGKMIEFSKNVKTDIWRYL